MKPKALECLEKLEKFVVATESGYNESSKEFTMPSFIKELKRKIGECKSQVTIPVESGNQVVEPTLLKKFLDKIDGYDPFKDMFTAWFINYNNGHCKSYTKFEIENRYMGTDWKRFINNIPTTRITGATATHFQQELQRAGIKFVAGFRADQEEFDKWMSVEYNKTNHKLLEHNNIGNY